MDKFTTEIIQTLAQNGNIGEVFRSHLEKAVNTLLAQELTAFLNYEKYDRIGFNSGNSRNGVYERTLHTEYGDLKLEIRVIAMAIFVNRPLRRINARTIRLKTRSFTCFKKALR